MLDNFKTSCKKPLLQKKNLNLSKRYIPAETKVAECIKADAGTGASIESGNQKKKINCADFIKEAKIKNTKKFPKPFCLKKKKFSRKKVFVFL